jgi:hypothetical protein
MLKQTIRDQNNLTVHQQSMCRSIFVFLTYKMALYGLTSAPGLSVGIVYAPEVGIRDRHFVDPEPAAGWKIPNEGLVPP